jgi:hypothetical protein
MCGITGFWARPQAWLQDLGSAVRSLQRRGPDGEKWA